MNKLRRGVVEENRCYSILFFAKLLLLYSQIDVVHYHLTSSSRHGQSGDFFRKCLYVRNVGQSKLRIGGLFSILFVTQSTALASE